MTHMLQWNNVNVWHFRCTFEGINFDDITTLYWDNAETGEFIITYRSIFLQDIIILTGELSSLEAMRMKIEKFILIVNVYGKS